MLNRKEVLYRKVKPNKLKLVYPLQVSLLVDGKPRREVVLVEPKLDA